MTRSVLTRRAAVVTTALATFAGAALAAAVGAGAAPSTGTVLAADGTPLEDSYIVVLKDAQASPAATRKAAGELAAANSGSVSYTYTAAVRGFAVRMSAEKARRLAADPRVASVQQDGLVTASATQSPATWGLDRIDQRALPLDNSYTYSTTASNVTAYIIDTGIRTTHVEFGGRATVGYDAIGDGQNGQDCNGHGTHVAGTVGSSTYGVAKAVRLVAVRVLNCSGSGSNAGVIAGVDWVTANAVKPAVANMSLGGGAYAALDTAVTNSINSGVTYALAAGNSNADACTSSPARTAAAITVGATTRTDARASFSNYGTCLDLFAPGEGITSAWGTGDADTNTISGTSMASPHVAGAAALYLADNPTASPAAVRNTLVADATPNVVTSAGTGSPNVLLHTGTASTPPPASWPGVGTATFFGGDVLAPGQTLGANQYLLSKNGLNALHLQADGNLVLYRGSYVWHAGTSGTGANRLVMQSDGNLVLYNSSTWVWQSRTAGAGSSRLVVQDDGNAVTYRDDTGAYTWQTSTGGQPTYSAFGSDILAGEQNLVVGQYLQSGDRRYTLLLQSAGNLVLYGPGYHVLWYSGTSGTGADRLIMQSDGNLVLYNASTWVWQSRTAGAGSSHLVVQNDGNAVTYRHDTGAYTWQSGTGGRI